MKILILGAKGMSGHVIYDRLVGDGHTVIGTSRFAGSYNDQDIVKFDATKMHSWFRT